MTLIKFVLVAMGAGLLIMGVLLALLVLIALIMPFKRKK